MSTNFPTSLDTFVNPSPSDSQAVVSHSAQHTNANDAIAALEAKVGIDNSANVNSLDYKVNNRVPYTGANNDVNLGAHDLTAHAITTTSGAYFQANGATNCWTATNTLGDDAAWVAPTGEFVASGFTMYGDQIMMGVDGSVLIVPNAGAGKVFTSDASGYGTWQKSIPVLPVPMVRIKAESYSCIGSDSSTFSCYNKLHVMLTDADSRLFTDPELDARIELMRFRHNPKKASDTVRFRGKKWTHPTHLIAVDTIDPEYQHSKYRGGAQQATGYITETRPTEWSLLGKNNYVSVTGSDPIPVERFFKMGHITIFPWDEATGNYVNVDCPVAMGDKHKINSMSAAAPKWTRPGYGWQGAGAGRPFARFKFRVSVRDPNGTRGARIVGPESAIVLVRAWPHPITQDSTTGLWSSRGPINSIKIFIGERPRG